MATKRPTTKKTITEKVVPAGPSFSEESRNSAVPAEQTVAEGKKLLPQTAAKKTATKKNAVKKAFTKSVAKKTVVLKPKAQPDRMADTFTAPADLTAEISQVAYYRWESRGRTDGDAQADWFEAEVIVRSRYGI